MPTAALRAIAGLLVPPLCPACGAPCAPAAAICAACARRLARAPAGRAPLARVGEVSWAAPYDGVARELVAALKFSSRVGLARVLAAAIAAADRDPARAAAGWQVVAVPAAPARLRHRGFDPADLIAAELARLLGLPRARCLGPGGRPAPGRALAGRPPGLAARGARGRRRRPAARS